MVLKNSFIALICALFMGWSGVSVADEYRPDQFLSLDLSKAVLSPKPLGPANVFGPVAATTRTDGDVVEFSRSLGDGKLTWIGTFTCTRRSE